MGIKQAISKRKREEIILNTIHKYTAFYEDHKIGNRKVYKLFINLDVIEGEVSEAFIDFLTKDR